MGGLQPWHILVLVIVLILLFGAKRLPDAARGLGRSLRILKAETKNLSGDDVDGKADARHSRQPLDKTIDGETTSGSFDKSTESPREQSRER
ncbi:MAG: Sec-independent protein translocase subunit TatA [Micromonosporaceae bacterium]